MDVEPEQSLDEWAANIAALEPEVRDSILARAIWMAANRRLPQADRAFAQAQADAIGRAIVVRKLNESNPRKR